MDASKPNGGETTLRQRMRDVALDLRWMELEDAWMLFDALDSEAFAAYGYNPIPVVRETRPTRWAELEKSETFSKLLALVESHLAAPPRCGDLTAGRKAAGSTIAYFSAEFGIHESLPIYAGGLGVLAGDHLKSAMDLGLDLTAVGLLYQRGVSRQRLDTERGQIDIAPMLAREDLPIRPARDAAGREAVVGVPMGGRVVKLGVFEVRLGAIRLLLLDADRPENSEEDRNMLSQLYAGGPEQRIRHEIALGVGGLRALHALGVEPDVVHLNEGHAAFCPLAMVCDAAGQRGATLEDAIAHTRKTCVFTTHTPVPAGHDVFPFELAGRYLEPFAEYAGLKTEELLEIGRPRGGGDELNMTTLALRLSRSVNGVSELHAEVSRELLAPSFAGSRFNEIRVPAVTNGVHVPTWQAREVAELLDRYLPSRWRVELTNTDLFAAVDEIPDEEIWKVRNQLRHRLVRWSRRNLRRRLVRAAEWAPTAGSPQVLDPDALLIVFARRFATYKRALLAFDDPERLAAILGNPERPAQLVFAGKAHPADAPGKRLIRHVLGLTEDPRFKGRVVMLEDYDLAVGRALVRGADVWLNTPTRPLEASGTSGMKAAMNGGLNLSILDGWWPEAFDGGQGWSIGGTETFEDRRDRDEDDADSLYTRLEQDVLPCFYDRDADGVPHAWVRMVKSSIKTVLPRFCAVRMVTDYIDKVYDPEATRG